MGWSQDREVADHAGRSIHQERNMDIEYLERGEDTDVRVVTEAGQTSDLKRKRTRRWTMVFACRKRSIKRRRGSVHGCRNSSAWSLPRTSGLSRPWGDLGKKAGEAPITSGIWSIDLLCSLFLPKVAAALLTRAERSILLQYQCSVKPGSTDGLHQAVKRGKTFIHRERDAQREESQLLRLRRVCHSHDGNSMIRQFYFMLKGRARRA